MPTLPKPRRAAAAALVVTLVLAGGCSGADIDTATRTTAPDAPVTSIDGIGLDPAQQQQCALDARTLEQAIDIYRAAQGIEPTSDADLVSAGYLEEESAGWDITVVDGTAAIVPTPGGACDDA